jgi:LPS-assembly protein
MRQVSPKIFITIFFAAVALLNAQRTNPVDRQVANPLTDTPNVNPISTEQNISPPKPKRPGTAPEGGSGELVVYSEQPSVEGPEGKRILTHSGNVDVRYGIYRIQADRIVIYEETGKIEADGNVIFDQGGDQRITGATAVWNYKTKLGYFIDSTGFTNQTNDGTVLYFTAERVERISLDELVIKKGKFTACEEAVPKWSFTADEARVKANDRVRLKRPSFRIKDVPVFAFPFLSIPIKQQDRSSGFLTPAFGYSATKGLRVSGAYYQTLGRSADATARLDIFSSRGIGYGIDIRTRANSRSFLNAGFYAVKDRILGHREDADHPDQGGTMVYAEGVHYFPNGFTAAVDVRLTSNLAFRQVFLDGVQQIISPIEVSQAFVNKSWGNYTLNILARSQVTSIPNVRVRTKNLPSINFEKRPSQLSFLKWAYFSFKTSLEGVSREDEVDDPTLYFNMTGGEPIVTPALGQRLDAYPQITVPLHSKYFNFTLTGGARITYYSNSLNSVRRVVGRDLVRKYGEFELDVRPVALAKNYYGKGDAFRFRHVIEPYITYRYINGVDEFNRVIRFDQLDTISDTNEIEYGLINRFYTRRYSEAVTTDAQQRLSSEAADEKKALSIQPYEIFNITVRGKYFFDETFGGALVPGRRNQIAPITALSFYTFGGVPRKFSPLNIDATFRPQRTIFFNSRMDVGLNRDGLRAISATVGYDTPLVKIFQTFYYTRAVTLIPSLAQYSNAAGKEPGTLRGSQWSPSVFLGDRQRGPFGGASIFFDFENRRATERSPMISSLFTAGYAFDCCAITAQYYTFNVGARFENRITFGFRLNGIGAIGTEQFGQGIR